MATSNMDVLEASLLTWVHSFTEGATAEDLEDLNDGRVIWAILHAIDGEHFSDPLPEPDIGPSSDWTRKWQNLKHVDKHLSNYYRDICNGQSLAGSARPPDLKAIAMSAGAEDLQRLIMDIIRATMSSERTNERMGQRLMSLGQEHAMAIAYELRNMQEAEIDEAEPPSRDELVQPVAQVTPERPRTAGAKENGGLFGDPLFEREEELLQAQATIEKLQATHASAQRQLQALRQDKEHLQEQFDLYRTEIDGKGRKATADDAYKKLQRQAESDRSYIDDLENQLQASKLAGEKYERQLQRMKEEQEAGQKLRDDLQMLRAENEDLTHKVKANDNLKKKIQVLQEQEKANSALRDDLKNANDRLDELDRLRQIQSALEKEIIEKKGLIRNQEYQINELTTTRKHAEYDARVLAQKLEAARERQERDHDAIEELRAKLADQDGDTFDPSEPTANDAASTETLRPGARDAAATTHSETLSQQHAEKMALLEQQLSAADARLKQAAERNAVLEDEKQRHEAGGDEVRRRILAHEQTIAKLERELEAASSAPLPPTPMQDAGSMPPPPPVAKEVAVLERENRLIASAWFDLTARLQNNNVSLGRRRAAEPKSWIGKQRLLVGPSQQIQR